MEFLVESDMVFGDVLGFVDCLLYYVGWMYVVGELVYVYYVGYLFEVGIWVVDEVGNGVVENDFVVCYWVWVEFVFECDDVVCVGVVVGEMVW